MAGWKNGAKGGARDQGAPKGEYVKLELHTADGTGDLPARTPYLLGKDRSGFGVMVRWAPNAAGEPCAYVQLLSKFTGEKIGGELELEPAPTGGVAQSVAASLFGGAAAVPAAPAVGPTVWADEFWELDCGGANAILREVKS